MQALHEEANLALAVVDERAHQEPVELLVESARQDLLHRIDRDADGLPLAGRDAGDRLEELRGLRRQADGDLVDHARMQDHPRCRRPSPRMGRDTTDRRPLAGAARCPMICMPSPGWLSTRSANACASCPVPATIMYRESRPLRRFHSKAERRSEAADKGDQWLCDEEEGEEEAADIGQLQEEERTESVMAITTSIARAMSRNSVHRRHLTFNR